MTLSSLLVAAVLFACTIMDFVRNEQIVYVVVADGTAGTESHKKQEHFIDKLTVPQVAMVERELKRQRLPPIGDDYYITGCHRQRV